MWASARGSSTKLTTKGPFVGVERLGFGFVRPFLGRTIGEQIVARICQNQRVNRGKAWRLELLAIPDGEAVLKKSCTFLLGHVQLYRVG